MKHYELRSKYVKTDVILTADKHFFASSARSTKRWARGAASVSELRMSVLQIKAFLLPVNFLHD